MRKFVFMLIVMLLAFGSALAASSRTCGENVTWVLDDAGKLTISGVGDMEEHIFSSDDNYWDRMSVKEIVIEDGVTSISRDAFDGCSNLNKVTIAESVTHIGAEAFMECVKLQSINLPNSVTQIDSCIFIRCTELSEMHDPDLLSRDLH